LCAAATAGTPYDLAIFDLQMTGGMDGLQLAHAVKAMPTTAGVRLILVTPLGQRGEGEAARAAGIQGYLTKPVRQGQLHESVLAVLGLQAAQDGQLITRHTLDEARAQRRGHILLAEDNVVNQKVALGMLKKLGYRADVAHNGHEVVEALRRQPYALVLMDCQMPELDGFAATAQIRQAEGSRRHTIILAMTANAMHGDRERCLAAGMDDYVSKPMSLDVLREKLERWFPEDADALETVLDVPAGPVSPGLPDPLNRHVIEDIRALLEDAFSETVEIFLHDMAAHLEELRETMARKDFATMGTIAHTMKGSSSNLGALHLAALCESLMQARTTTPLAQVRQRFASLELECARVQEALTALCHKETVSVERC
jgi:CheY-like chemotaxis protein